MVFRFPLLSKRSSSSVMQGSGAAYQKAAPDLDSHVLATDEAVCLVGDIHGRADLLTRLLSLRQQHFPQTRLIVLGDMIDRGDDSAEVLRLLQAEPEAVCLMGNHEDMLLSTLEDPVRHGRSWLSHGGMATLMSYGLRSLPRTAPELVDMADALRAAMGSETRRWLQSLPVIWRSGSLVAAHAGLDPALPPEAQETEALLWGHPAFGSVPRHDGLWVAHGHIVVDQAFARHGRLALDTGAYATGRLSYAIIDPSLPMSERLTIGQTP